MNDNLPPTYNSLPVAPEPAVTTGFVEEKKPRRKKVVVAALTLILVVASTAAAVYLAGQRQETRKEAADQLLSCQKWSGGEYSQLPYSGWHDAREPSGTTIYKVHYYGDVSQVIGWSHVYWCDYQKATNKARCQDPADSAAFIKPKSSEAIYNIPETKAGYTPDLKDIIVAEHFGGKCQIIQVDVTPCEGNTGDPNQSFSIVYVNSECPEATPTPGGLSCSSLTSQPAPAAIKKGDTITLTCTSTSQGVDRYEFRKKTGPDTYETITLVNGNTASVTISDYGCYEYQCRVCSGTECTEWGKAK